MNVYKCLSTATAARVRNERKKSLRMKEKKEEALKPTKSP